jgi:predicted nucleotidyltransferase
MLLDTKKLKILEPFILDINQKITASQIAKNYNFNQKSVYLFMESLEKQSLFSIQRQGKNKLYFLNKDNKQLIKHFICSVEHLRTINFYSNNPDIKIIIEKILPHINGIAIIFGSYANNTQNSDSDLDIFVIGKHNNKEIALISNYFNIEINIQSQKTFKSDTLMKEVMNNHIIIKGIDKYITRLTK